MTGNKPHHSRGAIAREVCQTADDSGRHCEERKRRSNPERHGKELGCFAYARNDERKKKGSGTPADAVLHVPHASGVRYAPRKGGLRRPPLAGALACRRSTTALAAATERHRSTPVTRFLGRNEVGAGVTRSRPSQCSGLPRRPVIVPAGRFFTRSRPGAGVTAPPAGTVPAPLRRRHPAASF